MDHVVIFKAAYHVSDGFGLADIGEKLVTQAFTLGCTFHQAGNIHKLHGSGQHALGLDDLCQFVQARVRHGYHAGIWLNGAKGEVLSTDFSFGQRIEKGGFADVGQADNTAIESHGVPL